MDAGAQEGRGPTHVHGDGAAPRFDLRFEAGRGLLRLARPVSAGPARVVALELALGTVRFPVDVTGGAARFRTRRTSMRSARMVIDPRDLARAAVARGFAVSIAGPAAAGALALAVRDEAGTIGLDAALATDGADVLVAIDRVRVAVDGPAPPWQRLARAAAALGLTFDVERGVFRLPRPARAILAEALVAHGWRLPDDRTATLAAPRLEDGKVVIELGDAARLARGASAMLEHARILAPVLARLVEGDLAGARDRLDALARRLDERPGAEPELTAHVARLACAIAIEREGHEEQALESAEGNDDCAMLGVGLRAALRLRDARLADAVAERLAAIEPISELAAEALVQAGELVRSESPERARGLLHRALARRPADTELLLRCIELTDADDDPAPILELVRRALSSPIPPEAQARIALTASGKLGDGGKVGAASARQLFPRPLVDVALMLAPDDPDALFGVGARLAREGERDEAVLRFDRAADRYVERGDATAAARTLARAAELLAGQGRLVAAEDRLARAAQIADAEAATWCALARVRVRLGALDAAATAYASLLELGARATASLTPALVEAACFHLDDRRDPDAAEPFLELLARRAPDDPRIDALRRRLRQLRASTHRGPRFTTGGTADLDSLLDAVERRPAGDARDEAVRAAIEVARGSSDPAAAGLLAERLAALDRLPRDIELLDTLERLAIEPRSRALIARAMAQVLRESARPGEAALALARAGTALADAATLRAAIDLAEAAEAWPEALEVVSIALDVVGDGPARAPLLARRARIEASS